MGQNLSQTVKWTTVDSSSQGGVYTTTSVDFLFINSCVFNLMLIKILAHQTLDFTDA